MVLSFAVELLKHSFCMYDMLEVWIISSECDEKTDFLDSSLGRQIFKTFLFIN